MIEQNTRWEPHDTTLIYPLYSFLPFVCIYIFDSARETDASVSLALSNIYISAYSCRSMRWHCVCVHVFVSICECGMRAWKSFLFLQEYALTSIQLYSVVCAVQFPLFFFFLTAGARGNDRTGIHTNVLPRRLCARRYLFVDPWVKLFPPKEPCNRILSKKSIYTQICVCVSSLAGYIHGVTSLLIRDGFCSRQKSFTIDHSFRWKIPET